MASFKDTDLSRVADSKTVEVPVVFPGTGETGDILYVRSRYSKQFREAEIKAARQLRQLITSGGSTGISKEMEDNIYATSVSNLVAGWTYDEPPTLENVVEFLTNNPQMYDAVNHAAAVDTDFFKPSAES